MGKAFASGNSRALFQHIRSTGPKRPGVNETITEKDGSSIHSTKHRLKRWADYFKEQFNWPAVKGPILGTREPLWRVNTAEPSLEEVQREVSLLKRDKAPGPDGLHPTLLKEGGQNRMTSLTSIPRTV